MRYTVNHLGKASCLCAVLVCLSLACTPPKSQEEQRVEDPPKEKTEKASKQLSVMSYNVRYDNEADGTLSWEHRKEALSSTIRFFSPDILGAQEVLHHMLVYLRENLPEYSTLGVGREDGVEQGEYSALFIRKDRFEILRDGYFWLSDTPDCPSKGWDAACERIATWAVLFDKKNDKEVFVLNTHLDHVGEEARAKSVKQILKFLSEHAAARPTIMCGDFNSDPKTEVYTAITDHAAPYQLIDTKEIAECKYGPAWSFHEFGKLPLKKRPLIDYIFVQHVKKVTGYAVLAEADPSVYTSDHAPLLVKLFI